MSHDIAIVGMSCRFPDSPDPQSFWRNCLDKRVCLRELDSHRWNHARIYHPNMRTKNRSHTERAGLLHDVSHFAARYFEVAPRRARFMDPQQRICLELARDALQDAGLERRPFARETSAVFLGASISEFANLLSLKIREEQIKEGQFGETVECDLGSKIQDVNAYCMPGSLISMSASCVAQAFSLGGVSITVDAACASALAAVVQAVTYLRNLPPRKDRSPIALAGGVYLMLNPENSVCFAKVGALAARECRPFDAASSGFILGEGAGMFVLKRLEDAQEDGDRIYSVIKSAVWNNDGSSDSPMTPSFDGQSRLLRMGFDAAGTGPDSIGYIECHGTATAAGDLTELGVLNSIWEGDHRPHIGSIKANLGHTLSAAGAAGLMRAALALHHRRIPPQAAWESWHPNLEEAARRFRVAVEPLPWEGPHGATVSAFGFGGTNCFVVLEGAPPQEVSGAEREALLGFFAPNPELLRKHLEECEAVLSHYQPAQVERALRSRRSDQYGLFLRVNSVREALGGMRRARRLLSGTPAATVSENRFALAPRDQLEGSHADFQRWMSDETIPELTEGPWASLPPSPLERGSYWPIEGEPPGPHGAGEEAESLPPQGVQRLSLKTHPYLRDHRLSGRAFLPLASALDYIAWQLDLKPPYGLRRVEVGRGLMIKDRADILVCREEDTIQLKEIRASGREVVAFRARTAPVPNGAPSPLQVGEARPDLDLNRFYALHTFHGPSLQGLLALKGDTSDALEARVACSSPEEWSLTDPRKRWNLDPLVVDSAFQLAIYWSQIAHGRGLLPRSIEKLEVWRPFPPDSVKVQVRRVQKSESGLVGDFFFLDDQGVCVALTEVRADYHDYRQREK